MRKPYIILFHSDWLVGSGLGDGSLADSVLNKDCQGLLYLSGRAVKGALREAARRLGLCRPDLAACEKLFFGSRSHGEGFNQPGALRVSSAHLPEAVQEVLLAAPEPLRTVLVSDLTMLRAQTALENGTARAGSLRSMECGIPGIEFSGYLECADIPGISEEWREAYLQAVAAAVKSMGAHRARGFGRCSFTLGAADGQATALPPFHDGLKAKEKPCSA